MKDENYRYSYGDFLGCLGIDGQVVMKPTSGIKVPGIRTRIRRESKVSVSLCLSHTRTHISCMNETRSITCIIIAFISILTPFFFLLFLMHGMLGPLIELGSLLGYVVIFTYCFFFSSFLL